MVKDPRSRSNGTINTTSSTVRRFESMPHLESPKNTGSQITESQSKSENEESAATRSIQITPKQQQKPQKMRKKKRRKKEKRKKIRKSKLTKPPLVTVPTIPIDHEEEALIGHESPSPLSSSNRTPKRTRRRSQYQRFPDHREQSTMLAIAQMAPLQLQRPSPYTHSLSPQQLQQRQEAQNMMVLRRWERSQIDRYQFIRQESQQRIAMQQEFNQFMIRSGSSPSSFDSDSGDDTDFEFGSGSSSSGNVMFTDNGSVQIWMNVIRGLLIGIAVYFLYSVFTFMPSANTSGYGHHHNTYSHSTPSSAVPPFARKAEESSMSMTPIILLGMGMVVMIGMLLRCGRSANNPVFWISWIMFVVLCYGGIRTMIDYDGHLPPHRYGYSGYYNPRNTRRYVPNYQFDEDFDDYFNRNTFEPVVDIPADPVISVPAEHGVGRSDDKETVNMDINSMKTMNTVVDHEKVDDFDDVIADHSIHSHSNEEQQEESYDIKMNKILKDERSHIDPVIIQDSNTSTTTFNNHMLIHLMVDIMLSFVVISCLSYCSPNQNHSFLVMMTIVGVCILIFFAIIDMFVSAAFHLQDQQFVSILGTGVCALLFCCSLFRCLESVRLLTLANLVKIAAILTIGYCTYSNGAMLTIQVVIATGFILLLISGILVHLQALTLKVNKDLNSQSEAARQEREKEIHRSDADDNPYSARSSRSSRRRRGSRRRSSSRRRTPSLSRSRSRHRRTPRPSCRAL